MGGSTILLILYPSLAVDLECTTLIPGQTGGGDDFKVEVFLHLQQGNVVLQSSNRGRSRTVCSPVNFVVSQIEFILCHWMLDLDCGDIPLLK